jgi:hypothetical protein
MTENKRIVLMEFVPSTDRNKEGVDWFQLTALHRKPGSTEFGQKVISLSPEDTEKLYRILRDRFEGKR